MKAHVFVALILTSAGCALSGASINLFEEPQVAVLVRAAPSVTDAEWQRGCYVRSQDEAKKVFIVRCPDNEARSAWTETRYCVAAELIDVVKRHWKKGWLVECDVLR